MRTLVTVALLFVSMAAHAQKADIATVKGAQKADTELATPRAAIFAQSVANQQVKRATAINTTALQLSTKVFETQGDLRAYQEATKRIDNAARTLQTKIDKVSRQDLILADARLTVASKRAEQLNGRALKGLLVSTQEVRSLTNIAAPTEGFAVALMKEEPLVPNQTITVKTLSKAKNEDVMGLWVYALPIDYMDHPELFDEKKFEAALDEFSFKDETSPTSRTLPLSSIRFWVGQRMKRAEMIRLAKQGKITRYKSNETLASPPPLSETHTFYVPEDLVLPMEPPAKK